MCHTLWLKKEKEIKLAFVGHLAVDFFWISLDMSYSVKPQIGTANSTAHVSLTAGETNNV